MMITKYLYLDYLYNTCTLFFSAIRCRKAACLLREGAINLERVGSRCSGIVGSLHASWYPHEPGGNVYSSHSLSRVETIHILISLL